MPPELTDEQLLAAIARGDRSAFADLWHRYARAALATARRVVADDAAAEDVVQDAFATIWRVARTFDPARGQAASWLFTIVRNGARDSLRRRRAIPVEHVPEVADEADGPDDLAIASFETFRLHAAVEKLGDVYRQVIELAYYEGLSQSEIADRTGLPLGTVKTRTRASLARLAELLGDPVSQGATR